MLVGYVFRSSGLCRLPLLLARGRNRPKSRGVSQIHGAKAYTLGIASGPLNTKKSAGRQGADVDLGARAASRSSQPSPLTQSRPTYIGPSPVHRIQSVLPWLPSPFTPTQKLSLQQSQLHLPETRAHAHHAHAQKRASSARAATRRDSCSTRAAQPIGARLTNSYIQKKRRNSAGSSSRRSGAGTATKPSLPPLHPSGDDCRSVERGCVHG